MKNATMKLLSLCLVVMLLVSAVPFTVFAADGETGNVDATTEAVVEETTVPENETTAPETTVPQETSSQTVVPVDNGQSSQPAGQGDNTDRLISGNIGDPAKIEFIIAEKDTGTDYPGYPVKIVGLDTDCTFKYAVKLGDPIVGIPNAVEVLNKFAQIKGTSADYEFAGCFMDVAGTVAANGRRVEDTVQTVYCLVRPKSQKVTLNAFGGILRPDEQSITIRIGEPYPTLPIPTRANFAFDGWYVNLNGVETRIDDGAPVIVNTLMAPYAKWVTGTLTATVQWYDVSDGTAAGWYDFPGYGALTVPANGTLSTLNGLFPTTAQINAVGIPDGYELKGWMYKKTGANFVPGVSRITEDNTEIVPRLQRTVTLLAQHPATTTLSRQSLTVEIGKRIGELPAPNSWAGTGNDYGADNKSYTFESWVDATGVLISTRENLKSTNLHPYYYPSLSENTGADAARYPHCFRATWAESKVVMLYFHTNNNTNVSKATVVPCYDIPADGSFNMNSLNLYKYFADYGKYDDHVDIRDGWYDALGWANYAQGKPAGTVCNDLWDISSTRNLQELHIMLIDKGTDANKYNNNNSTADRTNPKTGDDIVVTVAVLGVSVAALAAVYFLNKKRFVR